MVLAHCLPAADPCKSAEGGGISTPPVNAYTSTFYAHYSLNKLAILSTDGVTLTSDISCRGQYYYVPPCLNLEVYADTITIDRRLTITSPRMVRLFARSLLCLGADTCEVDTSKYDGKSYADSGPAPHGEVGLYPGQQGNNEHSTEQDKRGNGQVRAGA
jgi:hypothetical protein